MSEESKKQEGNFKYISARDDLEKGLKKQISDIRTRLAPTSEVYKQILNENPSLNLTSDIENKLIYDAKLNLALKDPAGYFEEKRNKLRELGNAVNAEFAKVYNDVKDYAGISEAKKMGLKSAKTLYEVGMHKIEAEYPEKLDKDLETKLLIDLKRNITGN